MPEIPEKGPSAEAKDSESFDWNKYQPAEDSTLKTIGRYAYQIPAGAAKVATLPADLLMMAGTGEALGEYSELEERLPELQKMFPQAPWDKFKGLDKEKYMEALQAAQHYFPTQENIERGIESSTGLPLTAKTRGQELLRLASSAGSFKGGNILDKTTGSLGSKVSQKVTAGLTAPVLSKAYEEMGVPKEYADMLGLGFSQGVPSPQSIPVGMSKLTTKSGLPLRGFDNIKKPTTVSPTAHKAIGEAIENDVRTSTDSLFNDASPAYREMKSNPNYRAERSEAMEEVRSSAEGISRKVNSEDVKKAFNKRINDRPKKGFTQSEYDREFLKETKVIHDAMEANKNLSPVDLIDQFRANNKSSGKIYEMGSSKARNEAKLEALQAHNDAISDVIEKKYPHADFSKGFIKENKNWSEMMDAEKANEFVESIVGDKLNFKNAEKILKDSSHSRSLRRMLGKEKFNKLQGIAKDFIERGGKYRMLKPGASVSGTDIGKDLLLTASMPWVGGPALVRDLYKGFKGSSLPKQQKSFIMRDL